MRVHLRFSFRPSPLALAVASLCLNLPAVARAQSAEPQVLPAVVVTAQPETATGPVQGYVAKHSASGTKTDTPLVETPQSISVITRDQMDEQGAQTLGAILRYTPGVYSQDNDLRFDQGLSARGFDIDTYLDGMKLMRTNWFVNPRIDPYFLERVEVLHGPASVLYGAASPGGLVNMVSKRPTDEAFHAIDVQVGNHDRYQLGFDIGGPVNHDGTVLYRITGLARDAGTQTDHIDDRRFAIAPSFTFKPSRDTTLTLLTSLQHDPDGGLFNPVPAIGTVINNPNGKLSPEDYLGDKNRDRLKRDQGSIGYLFEHRFNDTWTVRQNVRYLHDSIDYYQNSVNPGASLSGVASVWTNVNREKLDNFTIDNQLQAKLETGALAHTLLFGVDYQHAKADLRRAGGVTGNINVFNPDYSAFPTLAINTYENYSFDQLGAYVQDQIKIGKWSVSVGGRKDWTDTLDRIRTGSTATTTDQSDGAFTWRGGVSYLFDNGIAPYISYARSFQPQIGSVQGENFVPTTGKQYEVGIKYQPKGMNALFTAAVYDLRQRNVLEQLSLTQAFQEGEIRSRGIELEAHAELTKNFQAVASYTYMDQEVTDSKIGLTGKRPVIRPSHLASAWLDYTIHGGALDRLGFAVGIRHIGDSAGSRDNVLTVEGVTLADVAAHYDYDRHWRFGLNISNLFNKEYLAYCSGATAATSLCYWGQERSVLATARYQW